MSVKLKVLPSDSQIDEIILAGRQGPEMIVARISTFDLGNHFHRPDLSVEEAKRFASYNQEIIERAVARKYSDGEFHPDFLAGRRVACVHLVVGDIVANDDRLSEAASL